MHRTKHHFLHNGYNYRVFEDDTGNKYIRIDNQYKKVQSGGGKFLGIFGVPSNKVPVVDASDYSPPRKPARNPEAVQKAKTPSPKRVETTPSHTEYVYPSGLTVRIPHTQSRKTTAWR